MDKNNENNLNKLMSLKCNEFFKKPATERYEKFKDLDPFPCISESLLNRTDVIKYVLATGMIEDFKLDRLSEVTYSANFSGNIYLCDKKDGNLKKCDADNGAYTIPHNSITYLEIDTYFRVPSYIALRFNLRVKNVYKGLLLGTGPIIDPGYIGKIFIPLHNLTANDYIIHEGAKLIEIEFTKLSKDDKSLDESDRKMVSKWDFSEIPKNLHCVDENHENKDNRDISVYLNRALINTEFYAEEKKLSVLSANSEMDDKIADMKQQMKELKEEQKTFINDSTEHIANTEKKTNDKIENEFQKIKLDIKEENSKSERRENFIKSFSILSIIAMLLTAITLGITAYNYFYQASELRASYSTLSLTIETNETMMQDLIKIIDTIPDNSEMSDELKEKYNEMFNDITRELGQLKEQRDKIDYERNVFIISMIVQACLLAAAGIVLIVIYIVDKVCKKKKVAEERDNG